MDSKLEAQIYTAFANRQFYLMYQPQFCLDEGKLSLSGVEALLRINNPFCHLDQIIHVAENSGLIVELGYWVIETAITDLKSWLDSELVSPAFKMSINICATQLHDKSFCTKVLKIINETGVYPHQITLELTESQLINDFNIAKIYQLANHEIAISLDDFGTGYSSLNRLKILPIDEIKIDKIFVDDITKTKQDVALLTAMYQLTHALEKYTVVEGIETIHQFDMLKEIGFSCFQGYYFSEPLTISNLLEFFKKEFV